MATENKVIDLTFEAAEDLSSDQYRIVVMGTNDNTVERPNAATEIPVGILQNAPASGEEAVVRPIGCGGLSKVVLGATLSKEAIIAMEYVGATDAGKAQAAVATQYPVGVLLDGGDEDDLATCLLTPLTVKA